MFSFTSNEPTVKQRLSSAEEKLDIVNYSDNVILENIAGLGEMLGNLSSEIHSISERIESCETKLDRLIENNSTSLKDITVLFRDVLNDYNDNINQIIRLFAANSIADAMTGTSDEGDIVPEKEKNKSTQSSSNSERTTGLQVITAGNSDIINAINNYMELC